MHTNPIKINFSIMLSKQSYDLYLTESKIIIIGYKYENLIFAQSNSHKVLKFIINIRS